MDLLQRSGSRLLFLTAELYEEGIIDDKHKRRLKCTLIAPLLHISNLTHSFDSENIDERCPTSACCVTH